MIETNVPPTCLKRNEITGQKGLTSFIVGRKKFGGGIRNIQFIIKYLLCARHYARWSDTVVSETQSPDGDLTLSGAGSREMRRRGML